MSDVKLTAIARDLAAYLRANPEAVDTATGIARWWLEPQRVATLAEVEAALTMLNGMGVVESSVAADGQRRFRRTCDDERLEGAFKDLHG
jgi:hypothetical protein